MRFALSIIWLSFFTLIFACDISLDETQDRIPGLDFVNPAVLSISLDGTPDTVKLSASYPSVYPIEEVEMDTLVFPDSSFVHWKLNVHSAANVTLEVNGHPCRVWLVPADTLQLRVRYHAKSDSVSYQFSGPLGAANLFLRWKREKLKRNESYKHWKSLLHGGDTVVVQSALDSMLATEQRLLEQYRKEHFLPEWFFLYQREAQKYPIYLKKLRFAGKEYESLLAELPLQNERLLGNEYYYLFLDNYILRQYNILDENQEWNSTVPQRFMSHSMEFAAKQLEGLNRQAYYLRQYSFIQHYLGPYYDQELADSVLRLITHPPYRRFAERAFAPVLRAGDPAPEFELVDEEGNHRQLSDYKGDVILLAFWFAGCQPCIREIPYENQLINHFADRHFRLISICTKTTRQDWMKAVDQHGLRAINLFATAEDYHFFQSEYGLSTYPRYVLIDQSGEIRVFNASRPSEGELKMEIERLLEEG